MTNEEIKCRNCKFANSRKKEKEKCKHELMNNADIAPYFRNDDFTAPDTCPVLREQWKVANINIDFMNYGELKGKYNGKIKFKNGLDEEFSFFIYPGMTEKYIELIAEELVKGATSLGKRLLLSLGLKPKEDD